MANSSSNDVTSSTFVNGNLKKIIGTAPATDFVDATIGPKPGLISKLKCTVVDVIIRNVVGPHNFCVQDYRQSGILNDLEKEMTEFYNDYSSRNPSILHEDICADGYYAVQTSKMNNSWVRAQVVGYQKSSVQIMTYLLDHGCYDMVDSSKLRQLRKKYVDALPIQAYRAKLHFLGNEAKNWDTEECARFKEDVEGKPFCAIIAEEMEDDLFQVKVPFFSLVLIDTSGPKDVYLHHNYSRKK